MNEQLQIELVKIVTKISNGTESAWSFLKEQTPEVIHQLLIWHGVKSFIFFCVAIIFLIAAYIISIKLFKYSKILVKKRKKRYVDKNLYYDPFPYFAMWFFPLITTIGLTPIVIVCNLEWLKIWLAPKVWLLEYIKILNN